MKTINFISITVIFFCLELSGQNKNIMLTYQQSKFIYSPGLEFNYFFNEKTAINLGINSFIFEYEPSQLVNISNHYITNHNHLHFYNFNIGLCYVFFNYKSFKISGLIGGKWSYGPHFKPLYFYEDGNYYIYYDSAIEGQSDFGIDTGVFSYIGRFILGVKFSTDNNKLRYSIGWAF
tara:strand:+ start:1351 stop:1881 length:531 start_codon:yes stop_codon:yes gene_type:complete